MHYDILSCYVITGWSGTGKCRKSRLIQKLESGNRNIYEEYISFRYYKEKVVPGIERQRKKEFELLYIP